jgi:putative sterol carrier protein
MTDTMTEARAALREVVPRLVTLVRGVRDAGAASVGTWTAGDVAAHLSHVFHLDTDALAERPLPAVMVTTEGMAAFNATKLDEDGERNPDALADRIGALADEFDEIAARAHAPSVGWLQDIRLPPSAVACHLLEECLIHGHDIARATGRPWRIRRDHALLAIEGGVLPLIAALPPDAFLDKEKAASFQAKIETRLRGGGRTTFVFDNGALTMTEAEVPDLDACLWADPAALMLVFIGRQGIAKPVLEGKLVAWGRRPWKLATMLTAISPP